MLLIQVLSRRRMGRPRQRNCQKITSVLFIIYRLMKSNKATIDEIVVDVGAWGKALRFDDKPGPRGGFLLEKI